MTTRTRRRIRVPLIGPFGTTEVPLSPFALANLGASAEELEAARRPPSPFGRGATDAFAVSAPAASPPVAVGSPPVPAAPAPVPMTPFELANRGAPAAVLESARRAPPPLTGSANVARPFREWASRAAADPFAAPPVVQAVRGYWEGSDPNLAPTTSRAREFGRQVMQAGSLERIQGQMRGEEGRLAQVLAPLGAFPGVGLTDPLEAATRLAGPAARVGASQARGAAERAAEAAAPVARRLATGERGALGIPGKKPWQMTKAEWFQSSDEPIAVQMMRNQVTVRREIQNVSEMDARARRGLKGGRVGSPKPAVQFIREGTGDHLNGEFLHEQAIMRALRNGEEVPEEVLAEYPNLAREAVIVQPSVPPETAASVARNDARLRRLNRTLTDEETAAQMERINKQVAESKAATATERAQVETEVASANLAGKVRLARNERIAMGIRPPAPAQPPVPLIDAEQQAARAASRAQEVAGQTRLPWEVRQAQIGRAAERATLLDFVDRAKKALAEAERSGGSPNYIASLRSDLARQEARLAENASREAVAQGQQVLPGAEGVRTNAERLQEVSDIRQEAARLRARGNLRQAAERETIASQIEEGLTAVRAAQAAPPPPAAVGPPPATAQAIPPAAPLGGGTLTTPPSGTPPPAVGPLPTQAATPPAVGPLPGAADAAPPTRPPTGGVPPGAGGMPPSWETARDKLLKNIRAAKPARAETEVLYTAERQRRVAIGAEALESGRGTEAFRRAQASQAGTLPRARFELPEGLTTEEIDVLVERIRTFPALRFYEKLTTNTALTRLLAGDIPGEHELQLLQKVFGADLIKAILDKRKLGQKALDEALDAINAPRALMSSTDISAPLRQGAVLSAGHPLIASKNFGVMLKAMAKGSYTEAVQEAIHAAPFAPVREEAGLYLADIVNVAQRAGTAEEAFMLSAERTFTSRLLKKLPHVRLSERAYVTFLNKMRADVFDHVYGGWDNSMRTPQNARDLARFINFATGRGPLPGNEAAAILNAAFFAPRLVTSRLLLPGYSAKLILTSSALRKEVARDIGAFVGTGLSVLGLLKLILGDDAVEDDPHSPDFGRIRLGPTRIDFWAGFQPLARYAVQITTARAKELPERGASHYQVNRADRLLRFVRSKFAPTPSLVADILGGTSYTGEEVEFTGGTAARLAYQNTIPLFVQDLVDAAQADGSPLGAVKALGSAIGAGAYSVKQDAMMRYWAAVENEVPPNLKPQWDRYWELPTRDRRTYLFSIELEQAREILGLVAKQRTLRLEMRQADPELDAALVEEGRTPKTEQGRRKLEELREEAGIQRQSTAPAAPSPARPLPPTFPTGPARQPVAPAFPTRPARQPVPAGAFPGAFR